jgi:hypothetical protein
MSGEKPTDSTITPRIKHLYTLLPPVAREFVRVTTLPDTPERRWAILNLYLTIIANEIGD